jgi:hypothetical protein
MVDLPVPKQYSNVFYNVEDVVIVNRYYWCQQKTDKNSAKNTLQKDQQGGNG